MATVGEVNGTLIKLSVGGTVIGALTSNSISFSSSPRETTSKDSGGWKTIKEGLRNWSLSGEGFFAEDATYGFEDLMDAYIARDEVTIMESSAVTGDITYSGAARITSLERTSPMEETVTFSVSFEGSGTITKGVVA